MLYKAAKRDLSAERSQGLLTEIIAGMSTDKVVSAGVER